MDIIPLYDKWVTEKLKLAVLQVAYLTESSRVITNDPLLAGQNYQYYPKSVLDAKAAYNKQYDIVSSAASDIRKELGQKVYKLPNGHYLVPVGYGIEEMIGF